MINNNKNEVILNKNFKLPYSKLISTIIKEGYVNNILEISTDGNYLPEDADWNYKDIPHLKQVHKLIDNHIIRGSNDYLNSIAFQKIFGFIRFPICLINYDEDENSQVYYTSFLFYILVIKTSYEKIKKTKKCRVITTYNIFSPKFLFFTIPFIKFILRRNYHELMKDDIPMREQKGFLRSKGFSFHKDNKKYGFFETTLINRENVILPKTKPKPIKISTVNLFDYKSDDPMGYRVINYNNNFLIFNNICKHEGANLKYAEFANGYLKCPWHGRRISPIVTLSEEKCNIHSNGLNFILENKKIIIF